MARPVAASIELLPSRFLLSIATLLQRYQPVRSEPAGGRANPTRDGQTDEQLCLVAKLLGARWA